MKNRLEHDTFDAALHLLDRQVVDSEDLAVCKVDDLEISFYDDGSVPAVTRVLAGNAALVPRMSGRTGHLLRERWTSLGIQYAERDVPLSFGLDLIEHIGSAVELTVSREGLLDRQPPAPDGVQLRRMGELIGMSIESGNPELRGKVLDVRLEPAGDRYVLKHLLVGPGRPGSLLGYDRGDFIGPWLVASVVHMLHRHSRLVPCDSLREWHIDWDRGIVRLGREAAGRAESPKS